MVDVSNDTKVVSRRAEVTGVVRRRRSSDEEKGRIVAEAIAPGAVIAQVAQRHDLAPQHLSNWIRAADELPAFVPVFLQRQIPSGMPECALVLEPRRCAPKMRGLA